MRRRMSLLLAAAAAMAGASASAQEDPTNIVADQIRAQGYKCDSPQSAKRDPQASKPDEAVWIEFDQDRLHLFDGVTERALQAA